MIALALYPYMAIVLGLADFSTSIVAGSELTMGDITTIATSIFIAVYLHELLFLSSDVQWVSVVHHLGAVIVASVMVTHNVRWELEPNTTAYTVLIMTYGIFVSRQLLRSRVNDTSRPLRRFGWLMAAPGHGYPNCLAGETSHEHVVLLCRPGSYCHGYNWRDYPGHVSVRCQLLSMAAFNTDCSPNLSCNLRGCPRFQLKDYVEPGWKAPRAAD
jgi:hypothetical protein